MKKQILFLVSFFIFSNVVGQNFEGSITYKIELLNPDTNLISPSRWERSQIELFGDKPRYNLQRYYFKNDRYRYDVDYVGKSKLFVYSPKDKKIYSWEKNTKKAQTINTLENMDVFTELIDVDIVDTIMGIPCHSIVVKSSYGETRFWFNANYFKVDASLFKDHKYGHWAQVVLKTNCLPLKMEQKSAFIHTVQTAIEYRGMKLEDRMFVLPVFTSISASEMN